MKPDQGRKRYTRPALRHLGRMDAVTRKSKGNRGRDLVTWEHTKN